MVRIAFVVPGFPLNGGVKRILILANGMLKKGYDVVLLTHCGGTPEWFPNKVPVMPFGDCGADIYVVYECIESQLAQEIGHWSGKKYLLVLSANARKAQWTDMNIKLQNYTKVCTTEWLRDYCDSLGEKDRTSRILLLTGIDNKQFHKTVKGNPKRVGCYWKTQDPHQCLDELIEAFQIAEITDPQLELVELHSDGSIHPDDMKDFYSECGIWLVAGDVEGLGMPPLEAMACGCCLVTTDTKGNRFFAKHNKTALVSQPHDPASLAKNILLATDPKISKPLTKKGVRLTKGLSWQDHIDRFERVIR